MTQYKWAHDLQLIPESIADGWRAECSCGWRDFISFYEIGKRDPLLAELRRRHAAHMREDFE